MTFENFLDQPKALHEYQMPMPDVFPRFSATL